MYLSEYDRVWFSRLASPRKPEMSYRLGTIKEAYLKVVEAGLTMIAYFHWEPRRLLNSRLP